MADRPSSRRPAEDLASPTSNPATGDRESANIAPLRPSQPPQALAVPPAQSPSDQPQFIQADLVDEDTIEGDAAFAAEFDTQTIAADDAFPALDLSEELASIEAAAAHARSTPIATTDSDAAGVAAGTQPASTEAASTATASTEQHMASGKKRSWSSLVSWRRASVPEAAVVAGEVEAMSGPAKRPPAGEKLAVAERLPRKGLRERLLMRSVPSWLISMMLHVAMLMMLAAVQIEPVREAMGVLLTANAGEDSGTTLEEEFSIRGPELEAPAAASELDQSLSAPSDFTSQELALPETSSLASAVDAAVEVGNIGNVVESILPSSALNAATSRMASTLAGRHSGAMKGEMLERFGGNAASEKSVSLALKWLSEHQDRSGGWTFGHSHICRGKCKDDGDLVRATNAATALALLPFLGAGQTHLEGNYRGTVHNGLKFLISRMQVTGGTNPMGSWREEEAGGNMYSHGLAAIVVCEAYAMTRDPDLLQPAQLALNYIVFAQDPRGGGWRYVPKEPGDTSVVGWQLMALKSGSMGNLVVPQESFRMASSFLDAMSINDGAYYGYDRPTANVESLAATTAVGLLCRMYLGWSKDHPGLQEGVKYLSSRGPSIEDVYYSYYATQVLRQYGGAEWTKWNTALRDGLIAAQVKEGHAAGSWYSGQGHNPRGGRLYCTAMSAMILEVYYRHMPLYSEKSSDDDFEL